MKSSSKLSTEGLHLKHRTHRVLWTPAKKGGHRARTVTGLNKLYSHRKKMCPWKEILMVLFWCVFQWQYSDFTVLAVFFQCLDFCFFIVTVYQCQICVTVLAWRGEVWWEGQGECDLHIHILMKKHYSCRLELHCEPSTQQLLKGVFLKLPNSKYDKSGSLCCCYNIYIWAGLKLTLNSCYSGLPKLWLMKVWH